MAECSLCLETFNTERCSPRLLPCAHTFCLSCLEGTFKTQQQHAGAGLGQLTCALCQRVAVVPAEGAAGFPRNFSLLAMLEGRPGRMGRKKRGLDGGFKDAGPDGAGMAGAGGGGGGDGEAGSGELCDVCCGEDEERAATHHCQDCATHLCSNHAELHSTSRARKDHRVRGLAGVGCGVHGDCRLECYCITHAKPVCLQCALADHRACTVEKLEVCAVLGLCCAVLFCCVVCCAGLGKDLLCFAFFCGALLSELCCTVLALGSAVGCAGVC